MAYHHHEPVSKQLTIVVGLTVVGFMAFGLTLSFYRNILFEQTLEEIEAQNEVLRLQIEGGYRDLEYYRSGQYKDKYAKKTGGFHDGLGVVRLKFRTVHDRPVLAFKVRAYGDFSAADEPLMALRVGVGSEGGFLEAECEQRRNATGWILRFKNL